MDLITTIFLAVATYYLGKTIILWLDSRQDSREDQRDNIIGVLDKMIREVNIETYHGLAYWFDKENDRFLAQGSTSQEIIAVLKERFPNNVFLLPDGQVISAPTWIPSAKTEITITQDMFDKFTK